MNVKERFMSDAEGLLGFVDLSSLHLFHSGRNDLFFYAQQTDIKITLAYRLLLQKYTKTQSCMNMHAKKIMYTLWRADI